MLLDVNLRLATIDDVPSLADLWYAMLEEDRLLAPQVDPNWRTLVEADFRSAIALGAHVWVIGEHEGRLVASGAAFFHGGRSNVALTGVGATLAGVYTVPEFRRRGLARSIVQRLIEICRTRGCRVIRLRASEQGRPLYEQLGFVPGDEMVLSLHRDADAVSS